MADVTVVSDDQGATDTGGAEFAAGVAAATAAEAADDAETALERAEAAEASAAAAADTAVDGLVAAWDAQAEVEGLREEMRAGFATLTDAIGSLAAPGAPEDGEVAPAPEARQKPAEGDPDADDVIESSGGKKTKKRSVWWGDRG